MTNEDINKKCAEAQGKCYHRWSISWYPRPIRFCKHKGCWAIEGVHGNENPSEDIAGADKLIDKMFSSGKIDFIGLGENIVELYLDREQILHIESDSRPKAISLAFIKMEG